uniref:Glyoxylate reductase/hydroxypyruvate reductase n=1 Tax=Romanomermis culicivorax TaxID=13658 RepID=A0A915L8D5_ROMCU
MRMRFIEYSNVLIIIELVRYISTLGMAVRKPVVFSSRKDLPREAIDMLKKNYDFRIYEHTERIQREVLLKEVADADALLCFPRDSIDEELLQHAPKLKVISTYSVGYEHIDVEACKHRNIFLGHTPNVLTEATAELAIGLLICTSRRIIEANKAVYNGAWTEWKIFWLCGPGIAGSTVGILGMGRIGSSIAKKINAFSPHRIVYHNRRRIAEALENSLNANYVSLEELFKISDFLIISCQLSPETKHIVNKETLSKMKKTAILINISRGLVVDQDALYDALKNRQILAAGLDVTTPEPLPSGHKLLSLDNIVLLPHIGSATTEARTHMGILAAENIIAGLENRPLPASIY